MATLLLSVLPPPTPSSCKGSDAPMAPISAWSLASSPSGSHSRRKNGPREVPARMSTQGTILLMSVSRDLRGLDDLLPLDLFLLHVGAQLFRRHRHHFGPVAFEALGDALVGEYLVQHLVQ